LETAPALARAHENTQVVIADGLSSPSLPPSGTTRTSAHRPAITDRPTTTETPPSAASAGDQARLVFAATETLATESMLVEPRGATTLLSSGTNPDKAQK